MSIGALLTSHRRPHTLRRQLAAIDAQTVTPDRVVIWHNDGGEKPDVEAMRGKDVIAANFATGVWTRFAYCLWGFKTHFCVVLDDDTIPAPRWLEHLTYCHDAKPGLYGVNGVTFNDGTRSNRSYHGWDSRCEFTPVDIVGHAFFFKRTLLNAMLSLPRLEGIDTAGEDYALAFAAQACGLPVFVPPTRDPSTLGSTQPNLGTDDKALYRQPGEEEKKQRVHDFYLSQGWKPMAFRNGKEPT